MKRKRTIFGMALVAMVAILAVSAFVALSAPGPVYSVGQIKSGLAHYPRAWIGRTVYVRGVPETIFVGTLHGTARQPLLATTFTGRLFTMQYGSRTLLFNGAGLPPVLFLHGALPHPSLLVITQMVLARLPVIKHMFEACPQCRPAVYRIRLLNNGPCRAGFSGFCPHGMTL